MNLCKVLFCGKLIVAFHWINDDPFSLLWDSVCQDTPPTANVLLISAPRQGHNELNYCVYLSLYCDNIVARRQRNLHRLCKAPHVCSDTLDRKRHTHLVLQWIADEVLFYLSCSHWLILPEFQVSTLLPFSHVHLYLPTEPNGSLLFQLFQTKDN